MWYDINWNVFIQGIPVIVALFGSDHQLKHERDKLIYSQ